MTTPIIEDIVDQISDLITDVPLATALEALTATIMGTVEQCADPNRALLAVIAELTSLIRFRLSEPGNLIDPNMALPLYDWIRDAWKRNVTEVPQPEGIGPDDYEPEP